MRILVIHQYFVLPGMPGGSRFNELARMWTERGHEVTVIAGDVDYSTGESPSRYRGRFLTREDEGGVEVIRAHVPTSYGRGYAGRMWAFFGFTLSATAAMCTARRPDVVIATSPPLVTAIPGWLAARVRFRGVPFVFEVRDLWPESAVTTGVLSAGSPITRILYALERFAYANADRISVLTPAFREDIVRRGLAAAERIVLLPNGADVDAFRPGPPDPELRASLGWGDRFVALYAGAHGRANALGQLVEAAAAMRHRSDVLLACVGDGPEREQWARDAAARGLTNIVFHGPRPKSEMPAIVRAADAGVAVLQRNPTFRTVYPNKVFDYMACERPTVLGIDGVARDLVCRDARAGLFAEPEDAGAIAHAVLRMADDRAEASAMGRRGRKWVLAHATREGVARKYADMLAELCGVAPAPEPIRVNVRPFVAEA